MSKTKKEITSKDMMLMLYTFVAVQVPKEKMEVWNEGLEALKKVIDELDEIKKLFKEYNIEYKLTNVREALFALVQVRNSNIEKDLKAKEILKIFKKYLDFEFRYYDDEEYFMVDITSKQEDSWISIYPKDAEFNLLKEALKK